MRAVRIHGYGGPEVLRIDEVPVPVPSAGQVLVKVLAASINPIDWKIRRGMLASMLPLTFPRTLGRDCAGEAGIASVRAPPKPAAAGMASVPLEGRLRPASA